MKYSEIEIMFKNGKSLAVTCEKCIVKTQNSTLTGYQITNIQDNRPLFINLEEVVAIVEKLKKAHE